MSTGILRRALAGRIRIVSCGLALALLTLVVPASAQILYEDGPINGETDAWTINFGFVVSDTFNISTGNSTITGFSFGVWLTPGDVVESVGLSLTQEEDSGTVFFNQQVNVTQSNCSLNSYDYDICTETASFNGPTLGNGRYWVNLQNAVDSQGTYVFWDENSGVGCHSPGCPSDAGPGGEGTLPSEAFSILGTASGGGSVPEPGSLLLLGSGFLAFTGRLWRKMR